MSDFVHHIALRGKLEADLNIQSSLGNEASFFGTKRFFNIPDEKNVNEMKFNISGDQVYVYYRELDNENWEEATNEEDDRGWFPLSKIFGAYFGQFSMKFSLSLGSNT